MKPMFTVHAGEFLVGDHISRQFGGTFDTWVPTKDSGVDLLVTPKPHGEGVRLQVKFSRTFEHAHMDMPDVTATSWFTLDPKKVRGSTADLWVFVILSPRHEKYFLVVPTRELQKRLPDGNRKVWHLYFWMYADGKKLKCFQVRDLSKKDRLACVHHGVADPQHDFTTWLERWDLLGAKRRA